MRGLRLLCVVAQPLPSSIRGTSGWTASSGGRKPLQILELLEMWPGAESCIKETRRWRLGVAVFRTLAGGGRAGESVSVLVRLLFS